MKKENRSITSPLLRHEIGFILGQIGHDNETIKIISEVCDDETEDPIVRHEAILGLSDSLNDKTIF
jgi:hypothetical protein